jgi:pilus assembly protein CpaB
MPEVAVALALAATVALVAYASSADRRAVSGQQPVLVYLARSRIATGTSGEDARNRGLIERAALPRRAVAAGAVRSLEQLGGASPRSTSSRRAAPDRPLGGRGEASGRRLLPIPDGHQAVSIALDPTRQVSGFVTPGDRVSVVVSLSRPKGDRSQRTTRFLLQDVQGGGRVGQGRSQNVATVTLAVAPRDVERVVFAAENGSLYLSLLPPGQRPVPSRGRTIDNEF